MLKDLLAEATSRGFTSSEIYDELTVTLQDVQKCIDTAAQIVSGRLRGKGAGGKMVDVGGLKSFLQEVQALPCHLPQANALRVSVCGAVKVFLFGCWIAMCTVYSTALCYECLVTVYTVSEHVGAS